MKLTHPNCSPSTAIPFLWLTLVRAIGAKDVYSLSEVAQHSSHNDCWSAVYDNVYDLTAYAPNHRWGGGSRRVYQMCGIDSTDLYDTYHGDHPEWLDQFSSIKFLGILGEEVKQTVKPMKPTTVQPTTLPPTASTTLAPQTEPPQDRLISFTELSQHDTPLVDCWVVYYDTVYDLTTYSHPDPPGNSVIDMSCGQDGTEAYASVHRKSLLRLVRNFVVGDLDRNSEPTQETPTVPPTDQREQDQGGNEGEEPLDNEEDPDESEKLVTLSEVSEHNSPGDCWVVYYDLVYDLSSYEHPPPGNSVFEDSCGKDGTSAFAAVHPKNLLDLVQDLIVAAYQDDYPKGGVPGESSDKNVDSGFVSLQELQEHSTSSDCWVSYFGDVYDLSTYAHPEPPGNSVIYRNCGEDGTSAYSAFHDKSLLVLVKQFYIGALDELPVDDDPQSQDLVSSYIGEMTEEELNLHNTPQDCFVSYYGEVYDLTYYSHPSPPGQSVIYMACGEDGTRDYVSIHSRELLKQVKNRRVGWVSSGFRSAILLASLAASLLTYILV